VITEELMEHGRWDLSLSETTPSGIRDRIVERGHILITNVRIDPITFADGTITDASMKALSEYTGRVDRVSPGLAGVTSCDIGGTHVSVWLGDSDGRGVIFTTTKTFSAATWSSFISSIRPTSIAAGTVTNNPSTVTADYFGITAKAALDHACPIAGAEWKVTNDGKLDSGVEGDLFVTTPEALIIRESVSWDPNITVRPSPRMGVQLDSNKWVSEVHLAGRVSAAAGDEDIILASADLTDISATNPYKDFQGNADTTAILHNDTVSFVAQAQGAAEAALSAFIELEELVTVDLNGFYVGGEFSVGDYVWVFDPPYIWDSSNQLFFAGNFIFPRKMRVYARTWPVLKGMGVYYRDKDGNYTDLSDYVRETGTATIDVGKRPNNPISDIQQIARTGLFYAQLPPDLTNSLIDTFVYSIPGELEVATGDLRVPMSYAGDIVRIRFALGTAPTGSSAIADVNKNGTTVYTTQANRPTIADGANDSGAGTSPDVTAFVAGDYLTVDIDQIGSTTAGNDGVVIIEVTKE